MRRETENFSASAEALIGASAACQHVGNGLSPLVRMHSLFLPFSRKSAKISITFRIIKIRNCSSLSDFADLILKAAAADELSHDGVARDIVRAQRRHGVDNVHQSLSPCSAIN